MSVFQEGLFDRDGEIVADSRLEKPRLAGE